MIFVYKILKRVVRTSFGLFFAERVVINKEILQQKKARILVSNHPNTLIDPLNVASQTNGVVHFLANADLFSGKIQHWFFSTFFCIPIKRKQDKKGNHINNKDSFERCDEFLTNGGCLYIAPEGVSELERRLRPLKTGTARIALSAESKNDFSLGLEVIPIGLSYTAPTKFRSKVIVHVGEPIEVSDYTDDYIKNPNAAVRQLTQDSEDAMRKLLIDTTDEKEDALLSALEVVANNEEALPAKATYFRSKKLSTYLRLLKKDSLVAYTNLEKVTKSYNELLKKMKTNDRAVKAYIDKTQRGVVNWITIILGWPFFLYGFLNNILPAIIPLYLLKKLKIDKGYASTVKIVGGQMTFPLFYTLQTIAVHLFIFNNKWMTILYLLSLIPSGLFAWSYFQELKLFFAKRRLSYIIRKNKNSVQELISLRNEMTVCIKQIFNNIPQNIR